jgi:hypothetical protein
MKQDHNLDWCQTNLCNKDSNYFYLYSFGDLAYVSFHGDFHMTINQITFSKPF